MNKKILLVLLLLITCTLLTTTITTAATNNQTSTTTDNHILQKINKDPTNTKTAKTTINIKTEEELQQAIKTTTNTNDTEIEINLEKNDYTLTKKLQLNLQNQKKEITINGNNSKIQSNSNLQLFSIPLDNIMKLNNIHIANMTNTLGGAIQNYGTLICENVTFSGNTATMQSMGGGAIYNSGKLILNNCKFINNSAKLQGGSIYNRQMNQKECELIINNTEFTNNTAQTASTIFTYVTNCQINNSKFITNHATYSSIYSALANLNITNSYFEQEDAETIIEKTENCTIENTTFYNNHAQTIILTDNRAIIKKSKFIENVVNTSIILTQAPHNSNSTTTIQNSEFINNKANETAGIKNADNTSHTKLEENLFINNTSHNNGGVLNSAYGIITSKNDKFINNTSPDLFVGTKNNFPEVTSNEYKGNNLRTTKINVTTKDLISTEENIILHIKLETNPIYNTSITTGKILIKHHETTILTEPVNSNMINVTIPNNYTGKTELTVMYDGENDFSNCSIKKNITSINPEYEVNISINNPEHKIGQPIEVEVKITNTGKVPVNNISLTDIIPDNLNFKSCDDNHYNQKNNSIYLDSLNENSSLKIVINTTTPENDDLEVKFNIKDTKNRQNYTKIETIRLLKPEYKIISSGYNTSEEVYGNNITYYVLIKNIGKSEGHNFSCKYQNNEILAKPVVLINETLNITYNTTIDKSKSVTKIFTTNDSFNISLKENITLTIIPPSVKINPIIAHPGDIVNITAQISNVYKVNSASVVFKIQKNSLKNVNITVENNTIKLLNYKIPDNYSPKQYKIEVKYNDRGFESPITDESNFTLKLLKVYSKVDEVENYPGKYVTLHVELKDENNNPVQKGVLIFKINRKTIRGVYVNVTNGSGTFKFLIPDEFRNKYYNLSMVYACNNKYDTNRNSSLIKITPQESELEFNHEIKNNCLSFSLIVKGKNSNVGVIGGHVIFKINGKSLQIIKNINHTVNYNHTLTKNMHIYNLTAVYSGNNVYNTVRKTISFNQPIVFKVKD